MALRIMPLRSSVVATLRITTVPRLVTRRSYANATKPTNPTVRHSIHMFLMYSNIAFWCFLVSASGKGNASASLTRLNLIKPQTQFYKTFTRPVAKVLILAVFTYQVAYWSWNKLEADELCEKTDG